MIRRTAKTAKKFAPTPPAPPKQPVMRPGMWGVMCPNGTRVITVTELWCRRAEYTLTVLHDVDQAYDIVRTEILRQRTPPADAALRERYDTLSACVTSYDAGLAPASASRDEIVGRMIDGMLSLCVAGAWR